MEHSAVNRVSLLFKYTFGLVPIVAGLDKFTNLLADWTGYLPPAAVEVLHVSPGAFMMVIGVIEIIAGVLVLSPLTRIGAYIVSAWLALIAVSLIASGHYDIAVRDLVMAIAAFGLGQLAAVRERDPAQSSELARSNFVSPVHV